MPWTGANFTLGARGLYNEVYDLAGDVQTGTWAVRICSEGVVFEFCTLLDGFEEFCRHYGAKGGIRNDGRDPAPAARRCQTALDARACD